MKMKPALCLFVAGLVLCACSPHKQQASVSASVVPATALDFAQSNPDAQVSLHLPEGVKSYPDLHTQLYDEGRATLEAFIGQAHKSRAENSADGIDDPAYYHNITWKITAQSPRLVSLYATDDDFEGGAHPSASFKTVLWDKQTNTMVPADKLLAANADLREVDAYLCRQIEAERSRRAGEPMTQAGSGFGCPKFADSHLVLMPSTVSGKIGAVDVLFAPYDVGAYAEGPYEIRVPQSQLKGLISPAYADQFAGDAAGGEALRDGDTPSADPPAPQAQ